MKVLAIIPCYNEEKNIISVVDNLKDKAPFVDIIIVNDGSQDNTYKVCIDNSFPVINIPFNLGLANAVQTGMRYAYIKNYDIALQFDGDGQHLPEYISQMVDLMQESSADIIIGVRKLNKGLRAIGSACLMFLIKITTGKTITDPTSGMRLFNRKMIEEFAKHINYGPEPDTLAYLINKGVNIYELPVTMQERQFGKSYLNLINGIIYMLRMFVSIIIIQWFRRRREKI